MKNGQTEIVFQLNPHQNCIQFTWRRIHSTFAKQCQDHLLSGLEFDHFAVGTTRSDCFWRLVRYIRGAICIWNC